MTFELILSSLSVIFSIATFLVAIFAFLGWNNYRQFKEEMLLKTKEVAKIKEDLEKTREEAVLIVKDLSDKKIKGLESKKQISDYEKKAEDIIQKLESAMKKANRVSGLSSVVSGGFGGASSVLGNTITGGVGYSIGDTLCNNCGQHYNRYFNPVDSSVISSISLGQSSKCPYCGNINPNNHIVI